MVFHLGRFCPPGDTWRHLETAVLVIKVREGCAAGMNGQRPVLLRNNAQNSPRDREEPSPQCHQCWGRDTLIWTVFFILFLKTLKVPFHLFVCFWLLWVFVAARAFSSYGSRASHCGGFYLLRSMGQASGLQELRHMWLAASRRVESSRTRDWTVSPTLAGGCLSTGPPGKSWTVSFHVNFALIPSI